VTTWTNLYLTTGTTYWYRGPRGHAERRLSNVASATTFPPPAAPSNLTAQALSATSVQLTWTDNSSSESGFRIERSTDGVNFIFVGTVGANVTSWTNLYLTSGTTYHYRVRAYEGTVNGGYSNVAAVTP
jgi:hypothetical protein